MDLTLLSINVLRVHQIFNFGAFAMHLYLVC